MILKQFDKFQIILFVIIGFSMIGLVLWSTVIFDSAYYHQQNIHWNEKFSIVPGLGNFEDRYAFNSNYLLVSSLFSLRFLFQNPIYVLQSLLMLLLIYWILLELIRSSYSLKCIILLIVGSLFFFINMRDLADSSTDIVPNICTFYLISRILLYPKSIFNKVLLVCMLPLCLITVKLSIFSLCFFSVYILYGLIMKKRYKPVLFLVISSFLIIGLWFVRNVIISGYLVYPLYEIDLFSFDWKMPKSVLVRQRYGIDGYAHKVMEIVIQSFFSIIKHPEYWKSQKHLTIYNLTVVFSSVLFIFSPIFILIERFKKRKIQNSILVLYIACSMSFIYWILFAPDFRFANGIILATLSSFFCFSIRKDKTFKKGGYLFFICTSLALLVVSVKNTHNNSIMIYQNGSTKASRSLLSVLLYNPYSAIDKVNSTEKMSVTFSPYKIENGVVIYITSDKDGRCFDQLPATSLGGPPFNREAKKTISILAIEPRGYTLQKGFRPKQEYLEAHRIAVEKFMNQVSE